jgi:hypothetical protein
VPEVSAEEGTGPVVRGLRMWIRKPTKEALEVDLSIAGGGLFVMIFGGIVSVGGLHAKTSNNSTPSPLLGTIIVIGGLAIVIFGLVLAVANLIVWTAVGVRTRGQSLVRGPDTGHNARRSSHPHYAILMTTDPTALSWRVWLRESQIGHRKVNKRR